MAILAASGTVRGFKDQLAPLDLQANPFKPDPYPPASAVREPAPGASPITPDDAVAIARIQMPGAGYQ